MSLAVGQWAVIRSLRSYFRVIRIDALTPKLIKTRSYGSRFNQERRDDVVASFDDEVRAKELVEAIDTAKQPFRQESRTEHERHRSAIIDIQSREEAAIEAVIHSPRGEQE